MHFKTKDQETYISAKVLLTMPLKIARNRAKNIQNFREEKLKIKNQYPRVSDDYFGAGVSFEWPWQLERLELEPLLEPELLIEPVVGPSWPEPMPQPRLDDRAEKILHRVEGPPLRSNNCSSQGENFDVHLFSNNFCIFTKTIFEIRRRTFIAELLARCYCIFSNILLKNASVEGNSSWNLIVKQMLLFWKINMKQIDLYFIKN